MNMNRKSKNSKRSCFPMGLEKSELFSQETQNLRYETLKSHLLKKLSMHVPSTSFRKKAIVHVFVNFTPHRMNEYEYEYEYE